MKEYLEQRINQLEQQWEWTAKKYHDPKTSDKMCDYYYNRMNTITACIRELKEVLKKVEETK